jgi:hypothetical protein
MQSAISNELAALLETILSSETRVHGISSEQQAALQKIANFEPAKGKPMLALTRFAEEMDGGDCVTDSPPPVNIDTGPATDVDTDQTVDSNWPPLGPDQAGTPPPGDSGTPPPGDSGDAGDGGGGDGGGGDGGGGGDSGYW